jgi:hypothetical protein
MPDTNTIKFSLIYDLSIKKLTKNIILLIKFYMYNKEHNLKIIQVWKILLK